MGWGSKKAPGLFAESYLIQTQYANNAQPGAKMPSSALLAYFNTYEVGVAKVQIKR